MDLTKASLSIHSRSVPGVTEAESKVELRQRASTLVDLLDVEDWQGDYKGYLQKVRKIDDEPTVCGILLQRSHIRPFFGVSQVRSVLSEPPGVEVRSSECSVGHAVDPVTQCHQRAIRLRKYSIFT